ncbi:hypothetical protein Tco_1005170 [Tanacetum coccineum]|uniref:Retrotransposon gag domain-containing protein n=1 Tax=Tanacetum coccineum TaxID=301880 RepID=A0ABQ5FEE8_9ASTR
MASDGSDQDARYALSKLLQRGTVTEYESEFLMLIKRVTGISKSLLKSFYISGLKPLLQCALLRLAPTTLEEAFSIARIMEARFETIAGKKLNIEEKIDIVLSWPREEAPPEIKGSLDADEDIGVDAWIENDISCTSCYIHVFVLVLAQEARFTDLQLWELLRTNPSTLGEAFFRAPITEARFDDEINQAVDTIAGDQEDHDVKDKQEVKKVDDQEIENIKDEEGKNVEDHQVFEGDDNTNNDDVGYIEDEPGFLAHKIDYPNDNDARDQASELETKVLKDGKQDDVKVVGCD